MLQIVEINAIAGTDSAPPRRLPAVLAPWKTISSDIHVEANRFNSTNFGVESIQSVTIPEKFPCDRKFQAVFALSFFSHMPHSTWSRWLRRLWECVADDGYLVFTTHGAASRHAFGNPEIPESGIWFIASSEQSDLPSEDYGGTIVSIPYVIEQVRAGLPDAYVRLIRPGYWWGHQDLYVIGRLPNMTGVQEPIDNYWKPA